MGAFAILNLVHFSCFSQGRHWRVCAERHRPFLAMTLVAQCQAVSRAVQQTLPTGRDWSRSLCPSNSKSSVEAIQCLMAGPEGPRACTHQQQGFQLVNVDLFAGQEPRENQLPHLQAFPCFHLYKNEPKANSS